MGDARNPSNSGGLLLHQVQRFIRLRWIAAIVVLVGAMVLEPLGWSDRAGRVTLIGGIIVAYNVALWFIVRAMGRVQSAGTRVQDRSSEAARNARTSLLLVAWAQLLLDFGSLTKLTTLTGGLHSPVRGFFVFHMVFASLLLPRGMAYAGAGCAMVLLAGGLWLTGQWPTTRLDGMELIGWTAMLMMTVWVANGITMQLRRNRRRLIRQNKRVRAMSHKLRRQQNAMIQNEKMASAGRMAAGVAHEIANPLASMDGLLQMMQRRPEKARPEAIETLREQIQRVDQIVRRMTAFARPGDGDWKEVDLNQLVDKAMEVLRFDPRFKRVQLVRQTQDGMPSVRMLADAVQQVIVNLVINALDAMEGVVEPTLSVRTYAHDGWCGVEIGDNGSGIPKEHRKRLFEPFFTTKPVGKGTGLGLSISYSIVKQHGGTITVQSQAGKGTHFSVKLPVGGKDGGELATDEHRFAPTQKDSRS